MTDGFSLALALVVLAAALGVAVARPPYLSEALAASGGAVLLIVIGAVGVSSAAAALRDLGPTVGFLAAMLPIADGCRREGLFDATGAVMAGGARVEHEVVAAADSTDILVLARDGDRDRLGPRSLGPAGRFVVDHAACRILLIWPDIAPALTTIPPPPPAGAPPPRPPTR